MNRNEETRSDKHCEGIWDKYHIKITKNCEIMSNAL